METVQKKSRRLWLFIATLTLLPVLYGLSIGPVYALVPDGWFHPDALLAFYRPLWSAADTLRLGPALNDYVVWWITLFWK